MILVPKLKPGKKYHKTKESAVKEAKRYLGKPGYKITVRKLKSGYKTNVGVYGPKLKPQKEIEYL